MSELKVRPRGGSQKPPHASPAAFNIPQIHISLADSFGPDSAPAVPSLTPASAGQSGAMPPSATLSPPERPGHKGGVVVRVTPTRVPVAPDGSGEILGQGKFAAVKVASFAGEEVAAKQLLKDDKGDVFKQASKEATALAMVQGENIIGLKSFVETQNAYYILMELAKGGTLEAFLQQGPLSEALAQKLSQQIGKGLALCHAHHIYHRDIKTENIVFADAGHTQVKIADFGLSKITTADRQRNLKKPVGTSSYRAPELQAPGGYDGGKIDAWCFGHVVYRMVVGRPPFGSGIAGGYAPGKTLRVPASLSPACADVLRRLLAPDPDKRLRVSDALALPWLQVA